MSFFSQENSFYLPTLSFWGRVCDILHSEFSFPSVYARRSLCFPPSPLFPLVPILPALQELAGSEGGLVFAPLVLVEREVFCRQLSAQLHFFHFVCFFSPGLAPFHLFAYFYFLLLSFLIIFISWCVRAGGGRLCGLFCVRACGYACCSCLGACGCACVQW